MMKKQTVLKCSFLAANRGFSIMLVGLWGLLFGAWTPADGDPEFEDVTGQAGITHVQSGDLSMIFAMSGGAAAGDVDGDGWVDLFCTRNDNTDILYRNRGEDPHGVHLGFEDISVQAGFSAVLATNGAAFGDIENDGDLDLYVTSLDDTRFYLYINDGSGNFTEQAVARGAAVQGENPHYGFSVCFGDYDRDGYLDIHTNEWEPANNAEMSSTRLLHNLGAANPGHFEDVTQAAGVDMDALGSARTYAFTSRFSDLDGDGWVDLAIAADFNTSRLFWNNRDGTFTEATQAARVATDQSGMGSTIADYDNDGDNDWFVTCVETWSGLFDGNRLYQNRGSRFFFDVTNTNPQDADAIRNGGWGWGTAFFDYDNDMDYDLIMTNGMPDGDPKFETDRSQLWRQTDANPLFPLFEDVTDAAGIQDTLQGRGLLTFDYDKDGDLDVFIANNSAVPVLYRNNGGNANNWLRVEPVGTVSNRDGLGAHITITPDLGSPDEFVMWEVNGGSHFLSQSEFIAHFGLGGIAGPLDQVSVQWPSGILQNFTDVAINTTLTALEPPAPCQEGIYPSPIPSGDLNHDCTIDMYDFAIMTEDWLLCTADCG